MTKNNSGFFKKTGIHLICFILGLGGVIASAYTASSGHTELSIIFSVAAIVVSVFGFAIGIAAEHAKKMCGCNENKKESE